MTNPTLITTPFAENGDKNDIPEVTGVEPQNATLEKGFPEITQTPISAGGIPPERKDFNGILNLYGQHIVHLNKGLPYEFDAAFATAIGGYPLHARIMLSNGDIVQNTVANNTNNPNSNMSGWVKQNSTTQIFNNSGISQESINSDFSELISDKANKATTLNGYNIEDAYTKSEIDSTINAIGNGASRSYLTLSAAQSAASNGQIPINSNVTVTNDPTQSNNGLYNYNGSTLTKSLYDPYNQAKNYVDANPLFKPVNITSAIDFHDSARATGTYYVVSTSAFNSSTNKPPVVSTVKHGYLQVNKADVNNYSILYYSFADAAFYVDYFRDAIWQGWKSFKSYEETIAYVQNYVSNSIKIELLASPIDFLSQTIDKKYYIGSNAIFNSCTNTPVIQNSVKHGYLEQHVLVDDSIELVTFFSIGDECMYFNVMRSAQWRGWKSFKSIEEIKTYIDKGDYLVNPIALDDNNLVANWITKSGQLGFNSLDLSTLSRLKTQLGIDKNEIPIVYNKNTINRYFAKAATSKSNSGQLRVLFTGDSWSEYPEISNQFRSILQNEFGVAGTGFISVNNYSLFDSVTVTKSGTWSLYDASATLTPPSYGCAQDGHSLSSSTANSKITVANLINGDELSIFYGNGAGEFTYSLNGGATTSVTTNSSDSAYQKLTISGLSGTNQLVINVVSGTVAIHGFLLRKTTNNGIEFSKSGNAGISGRNFNPISPACQAAYAPTLLPDLVMIVLGTNDYRFSVSTVLLFRQALSKIIDGYRTGNTNCDIILIVPPQSNGLAVTPLSQYRDAMLSLADEKKCAVYNTLNAWSDYEKENSMGQWKDDLHLSNAGGYRLSNAIYQNILRG